MSFLQRLLGISSKPNLKKILAKGALLIDVRSSDEFKAGHSAKAINIPLQLISHSVYRLKGKIVIAVCKTGAKSAMAVSILNSAGIEAYNGGVWSNFVGNS